MEDKTRRLGIFAWYGYRIPVPERIKLIREAGFETVLHWWDDSHMDADGFSKEDLANLIRTEGLVIENAHLQFDHVNDLWSDTLEGEALAKRYMADIDGLAAHGILTAVLHPTRGSQSPPVTAIGMRRIRALVDRAEARGVKLALENVRNNDALEYIFAHIDSPMLGMCYDSGHDLIWSREPYALLNRHASRLFAVHLHDNLGVNDDHIAPGQGNVNWEIVRGGIERSAYTGSYTIEGDSADIPAFRTAGEHLRMMFAAGARHLLRMEDCV